MLQLKTETISYHNFRHYCRIMITKTGPKLKLSIDQKARFKYMKLNVTVAHTLWVKQQLNTWEKI